MSERFVFRYHSVDLFHKIIQRCAHERAKRIRSPIYRMGYSKFFIGVLIAALLDHVIGDEKSLFSNEDQILQLDVDNFNQKVYNQVVTLWMKSL